MILLIENYDSFVFNLALYVAELGMHYEVARNDKISLSDIKSLSPSHIIISPGPCTPNEAGISLALINAFLDKIPILGVCLGHQAIAQACGASVVRATYPMHGKSDRVFHDGKKLFADLPNPLQVGRYHSLIVDSDSINEPLRVTAKTQSGEIMAIEHIHYPVYGVQFHPESVLTKQGHTLLQRFLEN